MSLQVKKYTWIYNRYNDNMHVLLLIIVLLVLFIINFDYLTRKKDIIPNITKK